MEDEPQREVRHFQLLPAAATKTAAASTYHAQPWHSEPLGLMKSRPSIDAFEGPSLDLQLSISVRPLMKPPPEKAYNKDAVTFDVGYLEALRWQAAEQIRLAAMEKAYAERVRELTRREIEMAQSEFARARSIWERAREEVMKAEQLQERATLKIDSTCMEITCHSCSQKFYAKKN